MTGRQPRRWLEEEVAGLDIGDRQISIATVRRSGGRLTLTHAGWCPRPEDRSEKQLSATVARLWRDSRTATSTVCSVIQNRALIVRHFDAAADAPEAEVRARLTAEAQDILQVPAQHICLDWQWIHTNGNGASPRKFRNGLFLALPRTELEAHVHLLRKSGLFPVVIEVGGTAVANLYRTLRPARDEHVCLVHLRHFSADLCLFKPHSLLYPRQIQLAGGTPEDRLAELLPQLQEAMRYYQFKLAGATVQRVVFTGEAVAEPGSPLPGPESFGVPVERWNPLDDLPACPTRPPGHASFDRTRGASLAVALGLALRRGDDE